MKQEIRIPVSQPTEINQCGTWSIVYPPEYMKKRGKLNGN